MGKVRAKTLGDQELEQKEREEAEKRRLAKIEAAKAEGRARKEKSVIASEAKQSNADEEIVTSQAPRDDDNTKPAKKQPKKAGKSSDRSAKYKEAASKIEKNKAYSLPEAIGLLNDVHLAKFDETVELHINTTQSVSGAMELPHGTGKSTRVAILAPSKDAAIAETLLKEIESGKINFDVLVATPDAMPRLAKVARILGPRGLMPNPKNGTVTPNPEAVAQKYAGGHMTFKTEAKAPVLHLAVGKLSFGKEKLAENITVALKAVEAKNMKKVVLKSTMSPAIKLLVK